MNNPISLIRSDWQRYTSFHAKRGMLTFFLVFFHNPGMMFSLLFRIDHYFITHRLFLCRVLGNVLWPLYYFYTYYVLDIDVPPHQVIGSGLYVHNRGITFGADICGDNATLIGPLTVGPKGTMLGSTDRPHIGNHVIIFAGARVLGNIRVGNHVTVGANAVVTKDVPSRSVVGGVPAKIIRKL